MKQESKTAKEMFFETETAIQPLDEVIDLLNLVHDSFNLGNTSLDELERFDLLMNYQKIGSMLMLARRTIEHVRSDFYALNPAKAAAPDPKQTPAAG